MGFFVSAPGISVIKDIFSLLDPASKRRYVRFVLLSVVSSLLQTSGIAAISFFFTILLGGRVPQKLQPFVDHLPFTYLGLGVLLVTTLGTLSSALSSYWGIQISWQQYERISSQLLRKFLANDYEWHLQQNSAALSKSVITEAQSLVSQVLQQAVLILVRGSEVIFIAALLVVTRPALALVVVATFGLIYGTLYRVKKGSIKEQGRIVVKANTERQKAVNEALTGIKAVKVAKNEDFFLQRFKVSAATLARAHAKIATFSMMPKFWIELTLFGTLISFLIVSKSRGWNINESIPLLALYGAASIRLLPAAQQLYASIATITGAQAALTNVLGYLEEPRHALSAHQPVVAEEDAVVMEEVSYAYPNTIPPALHSINFRVGVGEKVGVVGKTGSGKTTLVDIILGLLEPQKGRVATCGFHTGQRSKLAYVPQNIHFLDATIGANIALGIPPDNIDHDLVKRAAQQAQIHDHILELPGGYDTPMGEAGTRFSGGQRQRVGIARALYFQPELLILDEASNALDAETERQVVSTLLEQDLTVIIIAHRISILRDCSRIVLLEKGRIVAEGSFADLLAQSQGFRTLAQADSGMAEAHDALT